MKLSTLAVVFLLALLPGCGTGVLYTHTVEPLTFNHDPTLITRSMKEGSGKIDHIQFRVSILAGENGLGEIAKKHGMKTIYYADMERRSILFGLWEQNTVHLYGR